ncbi:MAG TPA: PQQ-dependent sugar dehydrogenase [Bacteroidia bacterium]|nr:PQQ-dependent sugar dehydrogenase [Bacteroidia bacterium]
MVKKFAYILIILFLFHRTFSQSFLRSELSCILNTPWELTLGPDDHLWVTEALGKVARIDPATGTKTLVFTASDYFDGSPSEKSPNCHQPDIGKGTLGLALHPEFMIPATAYIYFVYSYNSNTLTPATKFKISRLKWDHSLKTVISDSTVVADLPTGYDHLGGRLAAVRQGTAVYLYLTIGDHGVSETNSPTCYIPQSNNPNNLTQDINYKNGKIHRFYSNGAIPVDNPVPGNSMFTRGHRNPQGLIVNAGQNIIYDVEHGDRTDDEINIIEKGKNYGWKNVRGYHGDNNYPGENAFVASYTIDPGINGDGLKEAFYSWCNTAQPSSTVYADWCTVAPSDGIYYGSNGIPGWNNSLLVVTLKNGIGTDMEVYKFQLNPDGLSIVPGTTLVPNPVRYFGNDQSVNGRLRDIAVSGDGKKIYLINNGGTDRDKITVYTYDQNPGFKEMSNLNVNLVVYPNPASDRLYLNCDREIESLALYNMMGEKLSGLTMINQCLHIETLDSGTYFVLVKLKNGPNFSRKIVIE